jgi:hypothetical protein
MQGLKVFLALIFFGVIGAMFTLLSIVLLPLAILVLVGLIGFLGYRIITYEGKGPSK